MVGVFRSWLASVRTTNLSVADLMCCSIQRYRSFRQISLGSISGGVPVCPGMVVVGHDIVGSRLIEDVRVILFQVRVYTWLGSTDVGRLFLSVSPIPIALVGPRHGPLLLAPICS